MTRDCRSEQYETADRSCSHDRPLVMSSRYLAARLRKRLQRISVSAVLNQASAWQLRRASAAGMSRIARHAMSYGQSRMEPRRVLRDTKMKASVPLQ